MSAIRLNASATACISSTRLACAGAHPAGINGALEGVNSLAPIEHPAQLVPESVLDKVVSQKRRTQQPPQLHASLIDRIALGGRTEPRRLPPHWACPLMTEAARCTRLSQCFSIKATSTLASHTAAISAGTLVPRGTREVALFKILQPRAKIKTKQTGTIPVYKANRKVNEINGLPNTTPAPGLALRTVTYCTETRRPPPGHPPGRTRPLRGNAPGGFPHQSREMQAPRLNGSL